MFARIVQDLFRRRVPHFLTAYLVASWAVIEFVDWLVNRYELSLYFVDLALVVLLSMIPTVFLLAYFHGALDAQRWTRVEKIGVPANLLAGAALVFLLFSEEVLDLFGVSTGAAPQYEQLTFSGAARLPSISPDGTMLAFVSRGDTAEELVLKTLPRGEEVRIAAYTEILRVQWSPDGLDLLVSAVTRTSVGDAVLSKSGSFILPSSEGKPQRIENMTNSRWSADGSQVAFWFQPAPPRIYLVNRRTQQRVSFTLRIPDVSSLNDLDWSHDSNLIAVLTQSKDGLNSIWTLAPDGSGEKKVLETASDLWSLRWSGVGDALYYLRPGPPRELWKVPVSPSTGAATGPPEFLLGDFGTGSFEVSADGRTLAFERPVRDGGLWLVGVQEASGGSVEPKKLTVGDSPKWNPSVSPDGKRVVFGHSEGGLATMPLEGGSVERLTESSGGGSSLGVWSPNGDEIAFVSRNELGKSTAIWAISASGGDPYELGGDSISESRLLTWAPGEPILYQRSGNRNYYFLDPNGTDRPLVSNEAIGWMFWPRYSPDRSRVAVHWNRQIGKRGVWLISLTDGSQTLLSPGNLWPIGWSPDGATVYAIARKASDIFAIPLDGGDPTVHVRLPFRGDEITGLSMTPNGRQFVVAVWTKQSDIWLVDNFDQAKR